MNDCFHIALLTYKRGGSVNENEGMFACLYVCVCVSERDCIYTKVGEIEKMSV